jgi:L-alanine-DL-glutamate epimerase-like enolase superfamily enzyme
VYRLFGLDPAGAPITTMSIGVDTPEVTKQKVEEAADFPVLKIKMGIGKDAETLEAIRAVTKKPLRVDANEAGRRRKRRSRRSSGSSRTAAWNSSNSRCAPT